MNPEHLGYGRDAHLLEVDAHWSTAYALIASSELLRSNVENNSVVKSVNLQNANNCGTWLLDNIGCESTHAPLWNLPYARKIWEDIEPVKKNTAFCIPTTHCIQAMFEISQTLSIDADLRNRAKNAAINAAKYFADNCFDETKDGIVFWYSPLQQHSFHVTNATAMMAGQLQRVSTLCPEDTFLTKQADKAIIQLLKLKFDDSKRWGWNYFGEKIPTNKKNRTNDLLHASFVCNGLLDYKEFGGSLSDEYDYLDLYNSLCRFYSDGKVYEYSRAETANSRKKKLTRILAIGHALYVAVRLEKVLERPHKMKLSEIFCRELCQKYIVENNFYYRPHGDVVTHQVRDISYALLGLAKFIELSEN